MSEFDDILKEYGAKPLPTPEEPKLVQPKQVKSFDELLSEYGARPEPAAPETEPFTTLKPSKEQTADLLRGVYTGAKSALAPAWLTPEERSADDKSTGELVVSTLTDLAVGVGATVAGTAALAAAGVPALAAGTAAALTYGLWSGVGQEISRSAAEQKDMSLLRTGLAVGLEANPVLRGTGKALSTVARALAQISGAATLEYSHSQDKGAAAAAAAFGVIPAGFMWFNRGGPKIKDVGAPTPETTERFFGNLLTEDGLKLQQTVQQRLAANPSVMELPKAPPMEFKRWLVGAGAKKTVNTKYNEFTSRIKPERLEANWKLWRQGQEMATVTDEYVQRAFKGLEMHYEDVTQIRQWASDSKFMARHLDDALETDLEGALDNVSRARDAYSLAAKPYVDEFNDIAKEAKRLKVKGTDITKALDPALPGHAAAKQRVPAQLLERAQSVYRDLYDQLHELGYSPAMRANYVPQKAKMGADAAHAVSAQIKSLKQLGAKRGQPWIELPEAKSLRRLAYETFGHQDLSQIHRLPGMILERAKHSVGFEPGAVFKRRGDLPEWMQELDFFRLGQRYLSNNLKAAYIDMPIRAVQRYAAVYNKLGLTRAAEWVDRWAHVNSGGMGKLPALWNSQMESLRMAGLNLLDKNATSLPGRALYGMPEFLGWLNSSVYSASLGLNLKAALRNLSQNYATTAPELGGTYGYSIVSKALGRTAQWLDSPEAVKAPIKAMETKLQKLGELGGLAGEIQDLDRLASGRAGRTAKWLSEKSLAMYQHTDAFNRAIAYNTGKQWAEDLMAGVPAARKALTKASTGLKLRIKDLADDPEALGHELGAYLIGKTQYRYDKAQLAQFGRELGTAFSMFSKWPLMEAANMEEIIRKRQWGRLHARLAPLLALMAVKATLIPPESDRSTPATTARWLLSDPVEYSPVTSLAGYNPFGGSPLVQAALATPDVVRQVWTEPAQMGTQMRRLARAGLKTYLPPVSQVINELDRYGKAARPGMPTFSRDLVNQLFGGPK